MNDKARIAAAIEKLRQKHIDVYGTDKKYLKRIGWKIDASPALLARWRLGRSLIPGTQINKLLDLAASDRPFVLAPFDRCQDPLYRKRLSRHSKERFRCYPDAKEFKAS